MRNFASLERELVPSVTAYVKASDVEGLVSEVGRYAMWCCEEQRLRIVDADETIPVELKPARAEVVTVAALQVCECGCGCGYVRGRGRGRGHGRGRGRGCCGSLRARARAQQLPEVIEYGVCVSVYMHTFIHTCMHTYAAAARGDGQQRAGGSVGTSRSEILNSLHNMHFLYRSSRGAHSLLRCLAGLRKMLNGGAGVLSVRTLRGGAPPPPSFLPPRAPSRVRERQ